VQNDVTVGCTLPKTLPDSEIRRFTETIALPWFYQNYQYAVSLIYYFIDRHVFNTDEFTKYKYITLPCEIQSIRYIFQVRGESLLQLGINTPNLSVNMGVTNQPYLSSYVTTIGELGVYKTIIDSMSDMLDQLNKFTTKFHFNYMMHRLNILTHVHYDLILEAYANVPNENLFADPYFQRYVIGWAKKQTGNLLGRFDFTLPGGVKYNSADLIAQGKEEMDGVIEEIKNMSTSGWFYMVKK